MALRGLPLELRLERAEELLIGGCPRESFEQPFGCFELAGRVLRNHSGHATDEPDSAEGLLIEQKLFATGAAALEIDGGVEAALRELAVQPKLQVARTLEFFEHDFVHAGAGIDEAGREDSERTALVRLAGRAEQSLRRVQR